MPASRKDAVTDRRLPQHLCFFRCDVSLVNRGPDRRATLFEAGNKELATLMNPIEQCRAEITWIQ